MASHDFNLKNNCANAFPGDNHALAYNRNAIWIHLRMLKKKKKMGSWGLRVNNTSFYCFIQDILKWNWLYYYFFNCEGQVMKDTMTCMVLLPWYMLRPEETVQQGYRSQTLHHQCKCPQRETRQTALVSWKWFWPRRSLRPGITWTESLGHIPSDIYPQHLLDGQLLCSSLLGL